MFKKLIEMLFGVKEEKGIARVNKVVLHFQDMLDDLATGSAEIKEDITNNQDVVVGLQIEIDDLKKDNAVLGAEFGRAADMQRAISAIISTNSK